MVCLGVSNSILAQCPAESDKDPRIAAELLEPRQRRKRRENRRRDGGGENEAGADDQIVADVVVDVAVAGEEPVAPGVDQEQNALFDEFNRVSDELDAVRFGPGQPDGERDIEGEDGPAPAPAPPMAEPNLAAPALPDVGVAVQQQDAIRDLKRNQHTYSSLLFWLACGLCLNSRFFFHFFWMLMAI